MSSYRSVTPSNSATEVRPSSPTKHINTSVPLHKRCLSCEGLVQKFIIIPNFDPSNRNLPTQPEKWEPIFMCTVKHLHRSHRECHFCNLIFVEMIQSPRAEEFERFRDGDVLLVIKPRRWHRWAVLVKLVTGQSRSKIVIEFNLVSYTFSETEHAFRQHTTAKEIPRVSQGNVGRAKGWIQTCRTEHDRCRAFHANTVDNQQRPSRVIEVRESSARLRCDMKDKFFDYLVLSHMWEKNAATHQIRLLESNLADFQIDIPWDKLCASAAFREAVRITWILGYRYLWIDALCIIQDSNPDWHHEADRMAIIYGNAVCNISVLFPSQSATESNTRNDPRDWHACILREVTPSRPGVYARPLFETYDIPWLDQSGWPLFSRAWTFQEYLLSPRTLLVGHKNLMFQCSRIYYDEILGPIGDDTGMIIDDTKWKRIINSDYKKTRYFSAALPKVATAESLADLEPLIFVEDWIYVFNEYRARKLSLAKDRVVAFAGIARAYSHMGKMTYLAGAWKECLPLCLLWYLGPARGHEALASGRFLNDNNGINYDILIPTEVLDPMPAPSWSWFSAPIYAYHALHFLFCNEVLDIRRDTWKTKRSPFEAKTIHRLDEIFWASLESFQFDSLRPNYFPNPTGFSQFVNLRITLSTFIVSRENLFDALWGQFIHIRNHPSHPDDSDIDCDPLYIYHPSNLRGKSDLSRSVLALMGEIQYVRPLGEINVQRIFAGLMLSPGREEGTWTRVGVWEFNMRFSGMRVDAENYMAVTERWMKYKIASDAWEKQDIVLV